VLCVLDQALWQNATRDQSSASLSPDESHGLITPYIHCVVSLR